MSIVIILLEYWGQEGSWTPILRYWANFELVKPHEDVKTTLFITLPTNCYNAIYQK